MKSPKIAAGKHFHMLIHVPEFKKELYKVVLN
jgi:hypothetical protein